MTRAQTLLTAVVLLASALGPAHAATASSPANDDFADATDIASAPFDTQQSTVGATLETDEPPSCPKPPGTIEASVWFTFTPDTDITVRAHTFISDQDTVLAAYTGPDLANLDRVACNDDTQDEDDAVINFGATGGTTYHFQVAGWCPDPGCDPTGDIEFHLSTHSPPANDDFSGRQTIDQIPFANDQWTRGATIQDAEPPACPKDGGSIDATVWYEVTPSQTVDVGIETDGAWHDTVLAVHQGTQLGSLTQLACSDDLTTDDASEVDLTLQAGETYIIQAGGWCRTDNCGATGRLDLGIHLAPPHDDRDQARPIGLLPYGEEITTYGATRAAGEPAPCAPVGATVWYRLDTTPLPAGRLQANTYDPELGRADFDTALAVYQDLGGDLVELACNDDVNSFEKWSRVRWLALPGATYYIQVGGVTHDVGELDFDVKLDNPGTKGQRIP